MSVTGRRVVPIIKPGEETRFITLGGSSAILPPTTATPPTGTFGPTGPGYTEPPEGVSWVDWGMQSNPGSVGWYGWEGYYTMLYFQYLAELKQMAEQLAAQKTAEQLADEAQYQYDLLNLYEQTMVDLGVGHKIGDTGAMEAMLGLMLNAGIGYKAIAAGMRVVELAWIEAGRKGGTPIVGQIGKYFAAQLADSVMDAVTSGLVLP